ncbi:hypothetical protein RUM43_005846 [Polyplax serrata]|uniref:Uncharacterized protein n=1 Tax=Polyplax serrata TaxID=468196 RepID=A0AAN8NQY3_POLSC
MSGYVNSLARSFIISVVISGLVSAKLSDYTTVCRESDPNLSECLVNSAQKFLEALKTGIQEYDLPAIDPMMVPIVDFRKAGMGLTLVIRNSTHTGVSNLKFTNATADPANYEFEFRTVLPVHTIHGRYTIDGKFMMLPIKGEGNTRIVLSEYEPGDVEGVWKIKGGPTTKDGVKYMNVESVDVSIEPGMMTVNFDNLFNGNKLLGDALNEVLNSQWKDLYGYVKPALNKSHSEVLTEFASKFFSAVPYSELFSK